VVLDHGKGARVWDTQGRDYVDFGAGIAVNALGHQDPDLLEALTTQAHKLWHTSNVFYSEPPLRLAEELVSASGFAERVFLCNSGTEANEAAIKLVRKWASSQGRAADKRVIVTFRGSFHGRTLAAVTATAQPKYQEGYEPLPGGFRYLDFNDVPALEAAFAEGDVAAVMLEPVQGEGGVHPLAPGVLEQARALADEHGAMLVLDEVQTGVGRSGAFFAWQRLGVRPHAVTLAKGLANGLPIGALLVADDAPTAFEPGDHASTFGGNPVTCAAACAVLDTIDDALLARVRDLSDRFAAALPVRGLGLLLAFDTERPAADMVADALARGLVIGSAGANTVRLTPPLTLSADEADHAIAILKELV